MADEDLKTTVRDFRASVSAELTAVHRRIDEFTDEFRSRLSTMETAILNEIRSAGGRTDRMERRLGRVEARLGDVEHRLDALEDGPDPGSTAG